jgi:hypothetical protein
MVVNPPMQTLPRCNMCHVYILVTIIIYMYRIVTTHYICIQPLKYYITHNSENNSDKDRHFECTEAPFFKCQLFEKVHLNKYSTMSSVHEMAPDCLIILSRTLQLRYAFKLQNVFEQAIKRYL